MGLKKKRASRRKGTRSRKRQAGKGRFRRFFTASIISATVSFGLASYALHPQLHDSFSFTPSFKPAFNDLAGFVGRAQEYIHLDRLGLGRLADRFAWQQGTAPAAVAVDGVVPTTFAQCPHFFPARPPIVPQMPALRELCFDAFAILHSGVKKTPVFVVQRLNRSMLSKAQGVKRTDRFYAEARLPSSERAGLDDYRGSGYSRGHMAPAGDMHHDDAMDQSFSLANMVPQDQTHNVGAWNRVENDTRKYVMRAAGDVYVFTGPVYQSVSYTIGDGRVAVPDYLYKLVYDATTGRSWVHWHVHDAATQAGPPISYGEFVRRTGLHLLPLGSD